MMKKVICCVLIIFNILTFTGKAYGVENNYDITMKRDLLILSIAYPGYIVDFEKNDKGNIFVIMKSGQKHIYDDKRVKTFEEKFANPDIQDVMEQIYPLGSIDKVMDKNIDPGRIRHYGILNEVYGRNRGEIEKNLKATIEGVTFNNKNGALEQLNKAFRGSRELCKREGKAATCFFPINGTYNYRVISGTGMLSPHAYAIAIDLNRNNKDYWKWATLQQGNERIKEYSKELPKVFEENNFVWGGKWSHFDILHYEYRPEIILKAKYFGDESVKREHWYDGVPEDIENLQQYIDKIDKL